MLNAGGAGRRFAVAAALSAGLLLPGAGAATADEPPSAGAEQCYPSVICEHADSGTTTTPGSAQTGGTGSGGGGSDGPPVCGYHGKEWACHDPQLGWFNNGAGCYFNPLDQPLPEGDKAWEGHKPSEGAIYSKVCPQTDGGLGGAEFVFVENGKGAGPISPEDVARDMVYHRITYPVPEVGIAPQGTAVVNSPVWLWAKNATPPKSDPLGVAGAKVAVTSRLERVEWDVEGRKVVCATAGTPYQASYGAAKSPDCGTEFTTGSGSRKDGVFTVTVKAVYAADVVITGSVNKTFTIPGLVRVGQATTLKVAEVQVLN
ncbi:hypothetical protein [Streptomyces sp. Y1]|uniref:ATP/GTP-binding protein n=1 Tax=Streptomyces sp. Y1 TaxID=3238634 RepID=A0AB39TBV2_9ACTN